MLSVGVHFSLTVASRPKILQNNSKLAVEKNCLPRKIGGCMATIFGEKGPKTGQKIFWCENLVF
jgi:hypothetical protein